MRQAKSTILPTNMWFWTGVLLTVASAYVLAGDVGPAPMDASDALKPAATLYYALVHYGAIFGLVTGLIYIAIGWNTAGAEAT